jgi:hypothetical protein
MWCPDTDSMLVVPHLTDGDLSAVHVGEELLHVTPGHAVQVHDVVLLPVLVFGQQAPVKKKIRYTTADDEAKLP